MNDTSHKQQEIKAILATRNDLDEDEMQILAKTDSKEVLISLAKQPALPSSVIDVIISDGVYMAKKNLIEKQTLSENHKEILLNQMTDHPSTYVNLFEKLKAL